MAAGWTVRGAASVMGSAHELDQTPCQDTHIVRTSPSGAWTCVVVCDGAGSAKFSKTGAEIASKSFADKLMEIVIELERRDPGAWINDAVITGALTIRQQLRDYARQDDLRDYHTTLLAALVGPTGGMCVHIGDGAIFGGRFHEKDGVSLINADWFLSEPENGEYANETYFITEAGWVKHLRISPLPPLDWIALATDGGAALALTHRNELKSEFMLGLLHELGNGRLEPSAVIKNALLDPASANITGDDKTLALIVRGGMLPPKQSSLAVSASKVTEHSPIADLEEIPTQDSKIENTVDVSVSRSLPSSLKKNCWPLKRVGIKFIIYFILSTVILLCLYAVLYLFYKKTAHQFEHVAAWISRGGPATVPSTEPQVSVTASPKKPAAPAVATSTSKVKEASAPAARDNSAITPGAKSESDAAPPEKPAASGVTSSRPQAQRSTPPVVKPPGEK